MATRKSIAFGTKFNLLTFLSEADDMGGKRAAFFRCDCGREKVMLLVNVSRGKSRSCGCIARRLTSERSVTHGHIKRGMHSRAYGSWAGMIARCTKQYRPDYHRYGGRGIKVCERWYKFENFFADMGDPPAGMTLDRFPDVNGNYEPGNARWATAKEQANNRRSNVFIEHRGKTRNIEAWAAELGIPRHLIEGRMKAGETDPDAIFAPAQKIRTIEYQGKAQTITQWADELGIKRSTIARRILLGYPVDLLFVPLHSGHRPKF